MPYTLLNATGAMLCVNLDTIDEKGRRVALILMDREKTRELTEGEYRSREVLKLVARGDLKDVSAIEQRRKAAAEATPAGGRLRMPERPAPRPADTETRRLTRPPDAAPDTHGDGR
jgi:hypothetical protein